MEIITMDSKVYQNLEKKINDIAEFVYGTKTIQEDRWLDTDDAAEMLGVSTRTLQRLRTDREIDYSMLRGRCRYRLSEIERVLNDRIISSNPKTLEELREGYLSSNNRK